MKTLKLKTKPYRTQLNKIQKEVNVLAYGKEVKINYPLFNCYIKANLYLNIQYNDAMIESICLLPKKNMTKGIKQLINIANDVLEIGTNPELLDQIYDFILKSKENKDFLKKIDNLVEKIDELAEKYPNQVPSTLHEYFYS